MKDYIILLSSGQLESVFIFGVIGTCVDVRFLFIKKLPNAAEKRKNG